MGSKNKLKRFKENETFKNVIQPTREEVVSNFSLKGKWNTFFKNDNPIVLELGCGKGEYTIALAQKNPDKNFIGIDIKGARFWRGAKTAIEENLDNDIWPGIKPKVLEGFHQQLHVDTIKTINGFLKIQAMGSPHIRHDIKQLSELVFQHELASEDTLDSSLKLLEISDYRKKLNSNIPYPS